MRLAHARRARAKERPSCPQKCGARAVDTDVTHAEKLCLTLWKSEGSERRRVVLYNSVPRLAAWLERVHAQLRYLPPLSAPYWSGGNTVHYDVPCGTSSVVRLDVCTRPARIADPQHLSARALPYTLADGTTTIRVMGLSDLIQTKKTQRLKDWGGIEMLLAAYNRQARAFETRKHRAPPQTSARPLSEKNSLKQNCAKYDEKSGARAAKEKHDNDFARQNRR